MKSMTCKQLGGACEERFSANSFEELADLSKQHGIKMFQLGDPAHLAAMQQMQALMQSPADFQQWEAEKRSAFENLQED